MVRQRKSTLSSRAPSFAGLRPASESASRAKRANKRQDTTHERMLRCELWRMGLRYRKSVSGLPGKPDIVFSRARVVVFCDGDFWHGRDWKQLRAALRCRHNADYWIAKISHNRERDEKQTARLSREGWLVIRLWEADIVRDPHGAATQIMRIIKKRLIGASPPERART